MRYRKHSKRYITKRPLTDDEIIKVREQLRIAIRDGNAFIIDPRDVEHVAQTQPKNSPKKKKVDQ